MASWASMVKERSESGLTIKEWCAQNSVSETAYYYRLRQLRKAALQVNTDTESTRAEIQEIQFARIKAPMSNPSKAALCIRRGETTIEVSNDASDSILSFLKEIIAYAV